MWPLLVAAVVLLIGAAVVAAYFIGANRTLSRLTVRLENENAHLLDRLLTRNGYEAVTAPPKESPIQSLNLTTPYEAAQEEWEREDEERLRTVKLSAEERQEIIDAAQQRAN